MSMSDLSSLRSASPEVIPIQPDHFYGHSSPASPDSDKGYLDPDDDPLATRGIPVFRPNIQDFSDFEGYMNKVECWGMKSGIVKIIPPKEWTCALPSTVPQLADVRLRSPIEQQMAGRGGLYRQQNVEKRRIMTVREWAELCAKEDLRAPTVAETQGVRRHAAVFTRTRPKRGRAEGESQSQSTQEQREGSMDEIKEDDERYDQKTEEGSEHKLDDDGDASMDDGKPDVPVDPASSLPTPPPTTTTSEAPPSVPPPATPPKPSAAERKEAREALDKEFLSTFEPHEAWLPQGMKAEDYTPEFCRTLERIYWRNCSLGRAPWYGADMKGSLFTDATNHWNVATLPSVLSRLLGDGSKISGVNTPYLYFGMWRATFAWHVEDMDLFSINYIHFGAPKHWYAVPQARSQAFETTMKGYFPRDNTACPQFLRHKSFLVSPTLLSQSSVRPNVLVQHAGEFVVTFPRGYHAGFNLGLNCAESVNFALDSWIELGLRAAFCICEPDSVRIDVRGLLAEKERKEREGVPEEEKKKAQSRKRKVEGLGPEGGSPSNPKRPKTAKAMPASPDSNPSAPSTKPKPKAAKVPKQPALADLDPGFIFPCCLCASTTLEGLLRVHDPPASFSGVAKPRDGVWRAHEACANVVPETWVDEIPLEGRPEEMERVIWGVDGIVRDRWSLKCAACSRPRSKAHGAPIQCTKGKCSKAFHVSCASGTTTNDIGVAYRVIEEVEKEVVLLEAEGESIPTPVPPPPARGTTHGMDIDQHQPPPSAAEGPIDTTGADPPASNSLSPIPPLSAPSAPPLASSSAAPVIEVPKKEGPRVIKTIKKLLVEVLCPQHNPVLIAQKKLGKVDQMRKDLAALGEMSRIRIRNSSGVLEVTLIKVLEERGTVEVLWDGGQKREFKWGSIVWGERQSTGSMPTVEDLAKQPHLPPPPSASAAAAAAPAAPAGSPVYVPPVTSQQQTQQYNPYSQPGQASFPGSNYVYQPRAGSSHPLYQGMSQFRAAPQPVQPQTNTAHPPAQPHTLPPSWNGQVNGYSYAPPPQGYAHPNGTPQYQAYYAHPYYQPHSQYAHAQSPSTPVPQQLPPLRPYPTQPGNTATGQVRPNQPAPVPPSYGSYYPQHSYLPLAPHSTAGTRSSAASKGAPPAQSSGETSTPNPGLRQEQAPSSSSLLPAMSSLDAPSS